MSGRAFRFVLGAYLALHFGALVPWAAELFSASGVVADGHDSPLLFTGNLFAWRDTSAFVTAVTIAAALLGVAVAAGVGDRPAAVVLCYLHACFLGRNPLILNPGLPYVGWLLLAHAALPRSAGEPSRRAVREAGWWLLALGYTCSGAAKLSSPSWIDGSAVARILENPLARDGIVPQTLLTLPAEALATMTWGILALELFFAPLALVARLRPWLWAALFATHLALLVVLDFADLTFGMVLIHLFTLDPAWLPARGRRTR